MAKIILEGLDRTGKSSLTNNIKDKLGYHSVLHFGKPQKCSIYNNDVYTYQRNSFIELFEILLTPRLKVICDRSYIGEAVYAPIYRGYSGDYVFDLEKEYHLESSAVKLILLTEDFNISKHFVSDGDSFDDTKREKEQELFIAAFEKSIIKDKKIICVTDKKTGGFRDFQEITSEALA